MQQRKLGSLPFRAEDKKPNRELIYVDAVNDFCAVLYLPNPITFLILEGVSWRILTIFFMFLVKKPVNLTLL